MIALDAPCKHGHTSGRHPLTGKCIECRRIISRRSYAKNIDQCRERDRIRAQDPGYKARKKIYKSGYDQERSDYNSEITARRRAMKHAYWKKPMTEEAREIAIVQSEGIKAYYWLAQRLTIITGIKHQVDHLWPLNHPLIAGLHVCSNLQIITARANAQKKNYLPEEWERIEEMRPAAEAVSLTMQQLGLGPVYGTAAVSGNAI